MRTFQLTLKALGFGIFAVALIHIVFGPNAEVMLEAGLRYPC